MINLNILETKNIKDKCNMLKKKVKKKQKCYVVDNKTHQQLSHNTNILFLIMDTQTKQKAWTVIKNKTNINTTLLIHKYQRTNRKHQTPTSPNGTSDNM